MILSFISKNLIAILCVTLALLVLVIAYRKLLAFLGRKYKTNQKFCVLHTVEANPAFGIIDFYFTADEVTPYQLLLLNEQLELIKEIKSGEASVGGNIIKFDSSSVANGTYFYQLKTGQQKISKKIVIEN